MEYGRQTPSFRRTFIGGRILSIRVYNFFVIQINNLEPFPILVVQ